MGYTEKEKKLVERYLRLGDSVLDMGSQNDYTSGKEKPPFISDWYKSKNIDDYTSIDLAGDNNSLRVDVSCPVDLGRQFNLVIDCGFGEHVVSAEEYEIVSFLEGHIHSVYPKKIKSIESGYYNMWLNKFNFCKLGGHIISINPKTGNWPLHCYSYVSYKTYWQLSRASGLSVVEMGEQAASGNNVDGWEVFCVMKKIHNIFPSFEGFTSKVQVYSK